MQILSINHKYYPSQDGQGRLGIIDLVVVLVEGGIEDYAAYIGYGNPQWVAEYGDKLSFNEACIHFPGIKKEKYRD